jgi:hypothetical protein
MQWSLAADGKRAWQRARSAEDLLQSPNFYVHVPSRTDPTAAPADGDSIMVLLPVANMQEAGTGGAQHMLDPACSASRRCCACAPPLQFKCKSADNLLIIRR